MNILRHIFKSTLGKKYIMAATGFFLFLFVVGHLIGNLQIFGGREMINRYGHFLQSNAEVIWPVRFILAAFLILHIWSAISLSVENNAARPENYTVYRPVGASIASRTMLWGGVVVFLFIIFHLLHYTADVKAVNLTGQDFAKFMDAEKRHDIYKMMVVGFNNGWISAFYIVGVGLLCLHLSHGISSMFQSMGWRNEAYRPFLDKLAPVLAWLIFLGYISIPVAILLGYGREVLK